MNTIMDAAIFRDLDPNLFPKKSGITETCPGTGKSKVPSKLAGISDENNRREIACSECKSGKPGSYASSAEYESVNIRSTASGKDADTDHQRKEANQKSDC